MEDPKILSFLRKDSYDDLLDVPVEVRSFVSLSDGVSYPSYSIVDLVLVQSPGILVYYNWSATTDSAYAALVMSFGENIQKSSSSVEKLVKFGLFGLD